MTRSLPDLTQHDTLAKVLAHNAANWPGEVALREKEYGIWNEITWSDYHARTQTLALGLRELGIGRGDVVGLIGDNRPDWVSGEIAAHALGALSLGIYRDALDQEIRYLICHAGAKLVLAEDEEQVDKLLELGGEIPSVAHIVYFDSRGMRKYDDPRLVDGDELCARGLRAGARDPGLYDRLVAETRGGDPAILCTTSGTTAHPKLAVLQAGALLRHCTAYLEADPKGPDDEYVSVLPLPWIMEQVYVMGKSLLSRMTVNFVEEPETTMSDLREIGPTFLLLSPRQWEAMAAEVRARIMDASWLKRRLYDLGMRSGLRALEQGRVSPFARQLLFRALKDRLGLSRLRSAATGGASLGPETFKFFLAMGVPLRQLYGQTELLGAYTIHTAEDIDFDTVGVPFTREIEVRIADPDPEGVGEIVTRHPNMFAGYYGGTEEPDEALHDGWLATGDAGYFNARDHLVVIDRVKDLAATATGVRFSPQFIENKLKFCPYVAEAMVLGAGQAYLSAIVCIRYSIVSRWAEKRRIAFTTYSDLAARAEVYDLLRDEVERVNDSLPESQRIRRFLLLYKELDADDGELTRTRKVRRGVVAEKYADIIEAIYSGAGEVAIDTTIVLQDGSRQRIRTTLKIFDLAETGGERRVAAE